MNEILRPEDEEERCGLVMRDGTFVEIENIAPDPKIGFELNPHAVIPLLETGEVVSTWHTHPKTPPNLSGDDMDCFLAWPDLTHVIIGRRGEEIASMKYRVEGKVVLVCD